MDPAKIKQIVDILRGSQRLDVRNPTHLDRAKKILQMANGLKSMGNLPPEINSELLRFYDTIGARPEVAGIRTMVRGSRWDDLIGPMPVFGRNAAYDVRLYNVYVF